MTRELFWLTLTVAMTALMWVAYILDRFRVRGFWATLDNPRPGATRQSGWAERLYFAHTNAVENLVIFAPLVLILEAIDRSTMATAIACAVYFWARLAHAIVYTLGLPVARTLAFAIGFFAQVVLVIAIFGKL